MATLALSVAGQFAGGLIGGPMGAMLGRAAGALAGSAIDGALFGEKQQASTGADFRIQGSLEGGAIPRLYGWSRLSGNIIWASALEEFTPEGAGAKGGGEPETGIAASFAVGFCEGEVAHIGRIWADGQVLETSGLTIRFHKGEEDQLPDSLIEARQGLEEAPAYRGLCYLVFERLPLAPFGNRIPNISVELCRPAGRLEKAVRAITVIPGASEFAYDPQPRLRVVSPGATEAENSHLSGEVSDWTLSIDELQALCPNLMHVALVVAWFGDDLSCGSCQIRPKVEAASRTVTGADWSVAGLGREAAQVVSSHAGGPAYGGTPSDAAVLAAIADLKARGLKVTLYPFVMMDIPAGNALPDPYSDATAQPPYPWRGRITCFPGPGRPGTADGTPAADAQVAAFVGAISGWGYRRFVRHYAALAAAGGADAFLLGSELRGLTRIRGPGNSFPFVAALETLAGEVREIIGPDTRLTYAADWSEYGGYQPGQVPGEVFFNLDPLWASPHIDAVGIDNYMPLADWRDGEQHPDRALWDGPLDARYLASNIAGGEGFDWFYQSDADRQAGVRTPVADGAYGEPFIYRFKDLAGWWSMAHHDRPGGIRASAPSPWVPRSKPIWFTELGCAAIDKGANQPNVFVDAKSAENALPYFSTGAPDPLAQRVFLSAHLERWDPDGADFFEAMNPLSGPGGFRMLDWERIYLWTWDARPYPAFPALGEVWADGVNHATGHWLPGRLGAASSSELLAAVAADFGLPIARAENALPMVHGMAIEAVVSARDALTPLLEASGLRVGEGPGGLRFFPPQGDVSLVLGPGDMAEAEAPVLSLRRGDPTGRIGRIALSYADKERDYLTGTVTAMRSGEGAAAGRATGLVLDPGGARVAAEHLLLAASADAETVQFSLPPSRLALEIGDVVALGPDAARFEITELRDAGLRTVSARRLVSEALPVVRVERPRLLPRSGWLRALPVLLGAHLPPEPATPSRSRMLLAACARPWPGNVAITDRSGAEVLARLGRSATLGRTTAPFAPGPIHGWDRGNSLEVVLFGGHLASRDEQAVLAGANRMAVEADPGQWEVIGFCGADLTGNGTYRLTRLLRGLGGSDHAVVPRAGGKWVAALDGAHSVLPVDAQWLGETVELRGFAHAGDVEGAAFDVLLPLDPLRPLRPGHLRARRLPGGNVAISFVRRSRADSDGWGMADAPLEHQPERYGLAILEGPTVLREWTVLEPHASYLAAQQAEDFGALPDSFVFRVHQIGPVAGAGHDALGEFHA